MPGGRSRAAQAARCPVFKFAYHKPASARKALEMLSAMKGKAAVLAGGTDLIPAVRRGKAAPEALVDIKGIESFRGIGISGNSVVIGSLATLADLVSDPILAEKLPVLALAAAGMGSPQVRNRGTAGGNLCNAAPSADLAPPLIVLGAKVRILAPKGGRTVPVEEFFLGPGRTLVSGGKGILAAIVVPLPKKGSKSSFHALTPRAAMDLSVVSVAASALRVGGRVAAVRIALGACAPVPLRCAAAEAALKGSPGGLEDAARAADAVAAAACPISDVRASEAYRRDMARELALRAVREVLGL